MIEFSLLVPTRHRPEFLKRGVLSALETADHPERVEVVAFIDDDDPQYDNLNLPNLVKIRGSGLNICQAWNKCYENAKGDYFMMFADDVVFRTDHWDSLVKAAIDSCPAKIGFVFGDDGCGQGTTFGTHGFVHRNWCVATGRFVPPYFTAGYCDVWLNDLGHKVGRHIYVPILTEHMHVGFDKAPEDDIYRLGMERTRNDRPENLYVEKAAERVADGEKLMAYRDGHKTVKWSILIATVGQREERFKRLLDILLPQVEKYQGEIEVVAYWNNFETSLGEIRQTLVESAVGDYISFIDDDDIVPDYYCDEVMNALAEGKDYVGWKMAFYRNGVLGKPVFHSLEHGHWHEDDNGYYRNVSHLNPIKREIALQAPFENRQGIAEDHTWSTAVLPLVKTQVFIDKDMYHYYSDAEDTLWNDEIKPTGVYEKPVIDCPYFRYTKKEYQDV